MSGCDGPNCSIQWFHFPCQGLTNLLKARGFALLADNNVLRSPFHYEARSMIHLNNPYLVGDICNLPSLDNEKISIPILVKVLFSQFRVKQ